jgi:hypothetical protein
VLQLYDIHSKSRLFSILTIGPAAFIKYVEDTYHLDKQTQNCFSILETDTNSARFVHEVSNEVHLLHFGDKKIFFARTIEDSVVASADNQHKSSPIRSTVALSAMGCDGKLQCNENYGGVSVRVAGSP